MNDKTVWIIGASSGIGKCLALRLADENYKVAISSRNVDLLNKISSKNNYLYSFPLDITDTRSLDNTRDSVLDCFGSISIVFFNAGDYSPMPLDNFSPQLFMKLITINYVGVVNGLSSILPYMIEKKSGEIYVTASLAGYRGLPNAAPYNASKAAVISLVESLHLELESKGISLRLINPGFVETSLTRKNDFDMPFLISTEKAAEYIYREMSKSNFEITFPKRFAWIMKLMRIMPYRMYFFLTKRLAGSGVKNNRGEGL